MAAGEGAVLGFSEPPAEVAGGRFETLAPLTPELFAPETWIEPDAAGPKGNWMFLSEDEATTMGVVSATRLHVTVEATSGLSALGLVIISL